MNLKPIFNRVIVEEIKESNITKSGITLTEKERPNSIKKGKILAVGSGNYENGIFIEMAVNVGEIILFEGHTAIPFNTNQKKLFLLNQTDILAKYEGDENEELFNL